MTADDVINAARSQVGVNFMHQGRCPGLALDCAGLGAFVASSLGVEYHEWPGYGRMPYEGLLESVLDNQPCLIVVSELKPGDLLLLRIGREPQHIAIFTGSTLIHSFEKAGGVCEHELDDYWRRRIVRIYRFKKLMPAEGPL